MKRNPDRLPIYRLRSTTQSRFGDVGETLEEVTPVATVRKRRRGGRGPIDLRTTKLSFVVERGRRSLDEDLALTGGMVTDGTQAQAMMRSARGNPRRVASELAGGAGTEITARCGCVVVRGGGADTIIRRCSDPTYCALGEIGVKMPILSWQDLRTQPYIVLPGGRGGAVGMRFIRNGKSYEVREAIGPDGKKIRVGMRK